LWKRCAVRRRADPELISRPALWDPLSAVAIPELGTFVTPETLRRFLEGGAPVELVYAGDRMWPALRDGEHFQVEPLSGRGSTPGSVLCVSTPIVDVLRLCDRRGDRLILQGDADPARSVAVEAKDVLGHVPSPPLHVSDRTRRTRRAVLSLLEAWRGRPAVGREPEETIRARYDVQAPFYKDPLEADDDFPVSLLEPLLPAGACILLAGSGTGRECFKLARAGFAVVGVDFSPAMTQRARSAAQRLGLPLELKLADLRFHEEKPATYRCVFLSGGFYSFIASQTDRVSMLRRAATWLAPDGVIVLSGRTVSALRDRVLLAILWARRGGKQLWGDAHARWINADAEVERSFLHFFTRRRLLMEARAAGLALDSELAGHLVLRP